MEINPINLIKKYGLVGGLSILLLLSLVTDIPREIVKKILGNSDSTVVTQSTEVIGVQVDPDNCQSNLFSAKSADKWSLKGYKIKDGLLCSSSNKEVYPMIWYNSSVPTLIESFSLVYQVPENLEETPPYAVGIGKDIKLLYLYFHENGFQIIGVEKLKLSDEQVLLFDREPPFELPEAPRGITGPASIKSAQKKTGKQDNPRRDSNHVPLLRPDTKEEYSFSIDVYIPDPNINKDTSLTEIGIGTLAKSCIEPRSYQLCQ